VMRADARANALFGEPRHGRAYFTEISACGEIAQKRVQQTPLPQLSQRGVEAGRRFGMLEVAENSFAPDEWLVQRCLHGRCHGRLRNDEPRRIVAELDRRARVPREGRRVRGHRSRWQAEALVAMQRPVE